MIDSSYNELNAWIQNAFFIPSHFSLYFHIEICTGFYFKRKFEGKHYLFISNMVHSGKSKGDR